MNELFSNKEISIARKQKDYFVTPSPVIQLFLMNLLNDIKDLSKDIKILDPCSGGDESNKMSYPEVLTQFHFSNITTNDIRENSRAILNEDYLKHPFKGYDMIIGNPPFKLCSEFVSKALEETNKFTIFLLPFNFFGGKTRFQNLFRKHMPVFCYLCHSRVFSVVREVAHFVWIKNENPDYTKLKIL